MDLEGTAAAIGAVLLLYAWTSSTRPSSISNWDAGYALLLGNERTSDRPWRGTIDALALVPGALSDTDLRALAKLSDPGTRTALLDRGAYLLAAPMTFDGAAATQLPLEVARRFFDLATQRNAFAVIATLTTADVEQAGPARVLSYSLDTYNRNFTLGQERGNLVFRVRTAITGPNGMEPHTETPPLLEVGRPVTVAATFDGTVSRVYVDGRAHGRQNLAAAGCAMPDVCDKHLPITAALFGALLTITALTAGRPRSRVHAITLVVIAATVGAALLHLLGVGRGTWLLGWGAAALVFAGAACVRISRSTG